MKCNVKAKINVAITRICVSFVSLDTQAATQQQNEQQEDDSDDDEYPPHVENSSRCNS